MTYKVLQLTNTAPVPFGAVAVGAFVPLGIVTRRTNCGCNNLPTFTLSTTGTDTVTINKTGFYRITYTASVVATAAGLVTLNLVQNGVVVATASETATAAGDTVNLTIVYMVRVLPNCGSVLNNVPSTIQITNTGATALTSGFSNLLIEQVC